jgi:hypothetical protein
MSQISGCFCLQIEHWVNEQNPGLEGACSWGGGIGSVIGLDTRAPLHLVIILEPYSKVSQDKIKQNKAQAALE